jgi:chitinase
LLSVTVGATPYQAKISYDILSIAKCVDFINLMTYNFNGHWNGKTGFHSPLFSLDDSNVEKSVNYWLTEGAPAEKLNIGIPFFGRSFTLEDSRKNGLNVKTEGPGKPGIFSNEPGYLGYIEVNI